MCVCACVNTYTHTHTYICTHMYAYVYRCLFIYVHALTSNFSWRENNLFVVIVVLKHTLNAIFSPIWGAAANSGNRL